MCDITKDLFQLCDRYEELGLHESRARASKQINLDTVNDNMDVDVLLARKSYLEILLFLLNILQEVLIYRVYCRLLKDQFRSRVRTR